MKKPIRKERDKFEAMARERSGYRNVGGVNMPAELRKALLESERGQIPNAPINVFLKKGKRNALNRLAREMDVRANALVRALINSAITLQSKGTLIFISAANEALEKANSQAGERARKRRLNEKPELEDDDEEFSFKIDDVGDPELDEDSGGEENRFQIPKTGEPSPELKRRKKSQKTGSPKPDEGGRAV